MLELRKKQWISNFVRHDGIWAPRLKSAETHSYKTSKDSQCVQFQTLEYNPGIESQTSGSEVTVRHGWELTVHHDKF